MPRRVDGDRPAAQIRAYLAGLSGSPPTYGRRQSPAAFMVSQISLRLGRHQPMAGRA
jgi:hypothetical protein